MTLGLALPSPEGLPGIVSVDGSWERQSYDATPSSGAASLVREERRRVGLRLADWSTSWLRWQAGTALDRLREYGHPDEAGVDARDYLAVESALDVRLARDRLALAASAGWWAPFAGGDRFAAGGLLASWRSTDDADGPVVVRGDRDVGRQPCRAARALARRGHRPGTRRAAPRAPAARPTAC